MSPVLLLLPSALASTVCSLGCDETLLGVAIANAAPGDEILVGSGTYVELLTIDKDLTIRSVEDTVPTLTNDSAATGDDDSAIIHVIDGAEVDIQGIALSGLNRRPVLVEGATLTLTDAYVTSVGISPLGGGVKLTDATFIGDNVVFEGNRASQYGGHINAVDSVVDLKHSAMIDGRANSGGGAIFGFGASSILIDDVLFEDNRAFGSGGAILTVGRVTEVQIINSVFANNRAEGFGGALDLGGVPSTPTTEVFIRNTVFDTNVGFEGAGAMNLIFVQTELTGSVFFDNEGKKGGGILATGTELNMHANAFCGNIATGGPGGAVYAVQGPTGFAGMVWSRNLFAENVADSDGGAVRINTVGVQVVGSHFLSNRASGGSGGAISVGIIGDPLITDVLFAWNDGSALSVESGGSANAIYSGWWQNSSNIDGVDLDDSNIGRDPVGFSADGDCTNDAPYPDAYSSLRDAGDPELTDPDGTRRDIGVFGGPDEPEGIVNSFTRAWEDKDGDGDPALYDCDDNDPAFGPSQTETYYDGIDTDCDAGSDIDADGDGYDAQSHGGDDCNDDDPEIHPAAIEFPQDENEEDVDEDCDGKFLPDLDGDGFFAAGQNADCDDADPARFPGANEVEDDGEDSNCDGFDDPLVSFAPERTCSATGSGLSWGWMFVLIGLWRRQ